MNSQNRRKSWQLFLSISAGFALLTGFSIVASARTMQVVPDSVTWNGEKFSPSQKILRMNQNRELCGCDDHDPWDPALTLYKEDRKGNRYPYACGECGMRSLEVVKSATESTDSKIILANLRHRNQYFLVRFRPEDASRVFMIHQDDRFPGHGMILFHFPRGKELELIPQVPGATLPSDAKDLRDLVISMNPPTPQPLRLDGPPAEPFKIIEQNMAAILGGIEGTLPLIHELKTLPDMYKHVQLLSKSANGTPLHVFEITLERKKKFITEEQGRHKLFNTAIDEARQNGLMNYSLTDKSCVNELFRWIELSRGNTQSKGFGFSLSLFGKKVKLEKTSPPFWMKDNLKKRKLLKQELPDLTPESDLDS